VLLKQRVLDDMLSQQCKLLLKSFVLIEWRRRWEAHGVVNKRVAKANQINDGGGVSRQSHRLSSKAKLSSIWLQDGVRQDGQSAELLWVRIFTGLPWVGTKETMQSFFLIKIVQLRAVLE